MSQDMILERWDEKEARFRIPGNVRIPKSFIWELTGLPEEPIPQRVVVYQRRGKHTRLWAMSWEKFLTEQSIDTVACIDFSEFEFSLTPKEER